MQKNHPILRALGIALLCACVLITGTAQGVTAGLLSRLSTRTGPGTQYDEPGTYFQNNWQGAQVRVISSAWDKNNEIWWVQVDFAASGKKFRAYTGLKRVNVDINTLIQEQPLGTAVMTSAARAYWGPGRDYVEARDNVPNFTDVTVYAVENGFVQVEFYDARTATSPRSLRRAWVTSAAVSGQWEQAQAPGSGSTNSNAYRFCPACGKELGLGNTYAFCPHCGTALQGSSTQGTTATSSGLPQKPWAGSGVSVYLKNTGGERLRPQCGPSDSYKRFVSKANNGDLLYQPGQIREMRALFTSGDFVLTEFIYSDGLPRIGYFNQSLFQLFEGVPTVNLHAARIGQATNAVNPFNGPGYHYGEFSSCRLRKGDGVQVFFEENGWYFCEFYTTGNDYGWVQLWLPSSSIQLL